MGLQLLAPPPGRSCLSLHPYIPLAQLPPPRPQPLVVSGGNCDVLQVQLIVPATQVLWGSATESLLVQDEISPGKGVLFPTRMDAGQRRRLSLRLE